MITPSGTSPEITKLNDKDLVYRTLPSDDYQGRALARTLKARGIDKVAVAYLNNDYGKGLAESFKAEFEANGGTHRRLLRATRTARRPTAPNWPRWPAVVRTRWCSSTMVTAPASACCARPSRTASSRPSSVPTA
jgi:amino acid/amide ABC transporter substrate-binding protein, HAAT family (TC 3.A.1.4.-)